MVRDALPDRKCNVTPGSFPVKDSRTGEAFPRCQLASFSADKECDTPLSGCLQAKIPKAPPLRTDWVLPLDGWKHREAPPAHQQGTLGLPASASSDKESYKRNPELCSVNRTT